MHCCFCAEIPKRNSNSKIFTLDSRWDGQEQVPPYDIVGLWAARRGEVGGGGETKKKKKGLFNFQKGGVF